MTVGKTTHLHSWALILRGKEVSFDRTKVSLEKGGHLGSLRALSLRHD
jgi:hypothetical protein